MRKVKSQTVGRDQGAVLFHMRAQQIPQSRMDQVGRRMISRGILPGRRIDRQVHPLTFTDGALANDSLMENHRREPASSSRDIHATFGPDQESLVPGLSSTFGIEGCDVREPFQSHPLPSFFDEHGLL